MKIGEHPILIHTGCVEDHDDGSGDGIRTWYIDVGKYDDKNYHGAAIEVNAQDEDRQNLIVNSVNAIIIAANELSCEPLALAISLRDNVAVIAQALVYAREGLQMVRDIVEDNGHEFPQYTWDSEGGVPGHALKLVIDAIDSFPVNIPFIEPEDAHLSIIRKMRDRLVELGDISGAPIAQPSSTELMEMDSIIKRAGEILGD